MNGEVDQNGIGNVAAAVVNLNGNEDNAESTVVAADPETVAAAKLIELELDMEIEKYCQKKSEMNMKQDGDAENWSWLSTDVSADNPRNPDNHVASTNPVFVGDDPRLSMEPLLSLPAIEELDVPDPTSFIDPAVVKVKSKRLPAIAKRQSQDDESPSCIHLIFQYQSESFA